MSYNNKLNLGIIGAGTIAHSHVQSFQSFPEVNIVAVAEIVEKRLHNFINKYNIDKGYENYKKLLERKDIDAVVICLPNYLHAPVAIESMKANKHVLVEKPMTISKKEAKNMIQTQKQTNKKLMISLQNRFHSSIKLLREHVNNNELGELYYAHCRVIRRSGIPGWGSWFTKKEESGGGPVLDVGVHILDQCLYIMGYPEPISVTGMTYSKFGPEKKGTSDHGYPDENGYFDVEDLATALITFENGITITLETSWAAHSPRERVFEILGDKGGIKFNRGNNIKIYNTKFESQQNIEPNIKMGDGRKNLTRHFINCCQKDIKPISAPEQGLILNKIFDGLYESAQKNGKQVFIK